MARGRDHSTDNVASKHVPIFKFRVDDKPYVSDTQVMTGASIKAAVGITVVSALFLEEHGTDPDLFIAEQDTVDLKKLGRNQFYTVPPATFGRRR